MTGSHPVYSPPMDDDRIATLGRSLPFYTWYARSPHVERAGQPGVMDLLFGNPHDMPMPEYVDALREATTPQDKDWFAYKDYVPAAQERKWYG